MFRYYYYTILQYNILYYTILYHIRILVHSILGNTTPFALNRTLELEPQPTIAKVQQSHGKNGIKRPKPCRVHRKLSHS